MKRLVAHIRECDPDGQRVSRNDRAWWWDATDIPPLSQIKTPVSAENVHSA